MNTGCISRTADLRVLRAVDFQELVETSWGMATVNVLAARHSCSESEAWDWCLQRLPKLLADGIAIRAGWKHFLGQTSA